MWKKLTDAEFTELELGLQEASEGLLPAGVPGLDDAGDLGFWKPSLYSTFQHRFPALQNVGRHATGINLVARSSFLFCRFQVTICHFWVLELLMYPSSAAPAPPPSPSPLPGGLQLLPPRCTSFTWQHSEV